MHIIIMIEYCIQKKEEMSVIGMIVPEISNNPETRDYKNKKNNLPMYGIVSLIIALIGVTVVLFNFNSLIISFASPILFISVITAGEGINVDIVRGTSIIGFILSVVFLLISLSPVILYIPTLFIQ